MTNFRLVRWFLLIHCQMQFLPLVRKSLILRRKRMIQDILNYQVVMMCGISGSGKTRYALSLADQGYTLISVDRMVWEAYGKRLKELSHEDVRKVYATINRRIDSLLRLALERGERVVIDSTLCKRSRRDELAQICREAGVTPILIYLHATHPVLAQRLSSRSGSGPDDQIITPSQLAHFCQHFEAPDSDENFITIEQG